MTTEQPVDTTSTVQTSSKTSLISIERVVALLTPVFAGGAGWLFTVITKAIPGINIPHNQFVTIFVSGAVLATTAALTWLFGRQKFIHFTQGAQEVERAVGKAVQTNVPQGVQLRQLQAALEAHEANIINSLSQNTSQPTASTEPSVSTTEAPTQ